MKPSPKNDFDFRMFLPVKPFFQRIYFGDILIPAVERDQDVFDTIVKKLKKYKPRTENNINDKDNVLKNAQNLYDGREMIINSFKNKLFSFYSGNYYEEFIEKSSESEGEITDIDTSEQITRLDKFYGPCLINKYFKRNSLKKILNQLKEYKNDLKVLNKYNNIVSNLIVGLKKLEKDINYMPKDEAENTKLGFLKNLVENIVDVNQILDDMSPFGELDSESKKLDIAQGGISKSESDEGQSKQGLKTLTIKQMITILPILLAQLKAGNNSEKLKNEIRQLLYSLYRSKNLSKTIYNSLISTI